MEQAALPTELILSSSRRSLGNVYLDWTPQPGAYVAYAGQTYAVLERHHRYQFTANRYHLHKIALYVQVAPAPDETTFINERWVVGDATCRYNAHSEILRCAVNPVGPCKNCRHYENRSGVGE